MASEGWNTRSFQELIDGGLLEIGDGYRAKNEELGGSGPIFLRAGHVADTHISFDGAERFLSELADRVKPKMAAVNDTIVTTKGNSTGRTSFVSSRMPPFVYSPHLSYWRSLDHDSLAPGFLRYWSQGSEFLTQLQGMKASTDMAPYLSLTDQRRLRITLPPACNQKAIAHILGTLDDKIELNRRMNETLEAMARAIFQSWFVDFDPVRAKREGRKPEGMDAATAKLFPDGFEESELGLIPRGWKARSLPEVFEINPTRVLSKGGFAPYLDMSNMPTQGPSPESWIMREVGSGMKFVNGDTLVARITPCLENGKTAFVDFLADGEVGWGSTEYIVLRPIGAIPPLFAYLLARADDFRTFAIQQMTGSSGRQRVPVDSFKKYHIPTPGIDSLIFRHFGDVVSPLFNRIKVTMDESRTLARLRDALLPKLLSGEIRVSQTERIVEAVL